MAKYDHGAMEERWQRVWNEQRAHAADDARGEEEYLLVEFPYPSGDGLHVGHLRSYTAMDVIARKHRMEGKNVLYPMGWDAFGLPAENYAIKTGEHPRVTTERNIANFKRQLMAAGFSFDWSREVNTTDPAYYRWTQWIFLKLLERGLAYKARVPINWCPSCKIGLANEEVVGGRCERCGGVVDKREKEQWMLKITAYAEQLLDGLHHVDYIEAAKAQQRNWIGRSEGANITFSVIASPGALVGAKQSWPSTVNAGIATSQTPRNDMVISVFTTRPDTLFGATFLVVSPELAQRWMDAGWQASDDVRAYVAAARKVTDMDRAADAREKTGVAAGITAVNPANGEEISVWVADYVLGSYGTGAIMAVPAHDERDFGFAQKYGLHITTVIARSESASDVAIPANEEVYTGDGLLTNSGAFDGMRSDEARAAITEAVGGTMTVTYKLRDWVFSRQRYWGEPIPVVFCAACGTVPVPEDQLPILLPEVERYEPTDTGESPLANIASFVNTNCPRCGGPAKRETDVMPNWAGSSWYFLAYAMHGELFPRTPLTGIAASRTPRNDRQGRWSQELLQHWLPVDWYNGGMEHTTLHLLYSRFWNLFLHDIGVVPVAEPYQKRTSHGMILAANGEKMSKSRGNVVNPDDIIAQYGADAVRLYEMFIGPFDQAVPWSTDGLKGCRRFLEKVWTYATGPIQHVVEEVSEKTLKRALHKTMKKVSEDIEAMRFNTAIAAMMEFMNLVARDPREFAADGSPIRSDFLRLLAPFAPHLAEELWEKLGNKKSVLAHPWPHYDPTLIVDEEVNLVVQVNGKHRATIRVPAGTSEEDARARALGEANVRKHLGERDPVRVVFVPDKIVNFIRE
ncbi:MAG: leucine--tRNA ligase [bacterium]|nr:leucine--tRNA ligase [bacterium]